jgi:hypothetical protein
MARSLELLASGEETEEALAAVKTGIATLPGCGACRHPDGSARFVASTIEAFDDVETHLARGTCGREVRGLMPVIRTDSP